LTSGIASPKTTKFNEIVTFLSNGWDEGYIQLVEYNCNLSGGPIQWHGIYFEPLISDAILAEELATVREPEILEFDRMLKRVLG
jgi:hypothetical protein